MSHFTVIVFGENPEKQLQPYHEFECTDQNDEYVQDVDVTETMRDDYEEFVTDKEHTSFARYCMKDLGIAALKPGETLDIEERHKYGYCVIDKEGNVVKVVQRTNPNAKWDWWIVGGRWSGFFKLKNGAPGILGEKGLMGNRNHNPGYADIAKKKDIDFAGMEETAAKKAEEIYDKVAALVPSMSWESWKSVRTRIKDIDAAQNFYNNQPAIKAISESKEFNFLFRPDQLLIGREAYIEAAKTKPYIPYAFVKDSKWFSAGDMGWFGISKNENDPAFTKLFLETLKAADPETMLAVVDCHI